MADLQAHRFKDPALVGLTIVLLGMAIYSAVDLSMSPWGRGLVGSDLVKGYLPGARRFLESGSPYEPFQLAGPYPLGYHTFIHPPAALALFVPFLAIPVPLWWLAPIIITALALWLMHPARWTWPLIALCLAWPRSIGSLFAGNTDMWMMAAVAARAVSGWPVVALLVKPTFAPLALVGAGRRVTWVVVGVVVLALVPTISLWQAWLTVITSARLGPAYSVFNLPLVMIGVFAAVGAQRDRGLALPRLGLRRSG